jgi:hypothetical protein
VIADTELEAWRQEWHGQAEVLPELKRKVRRQNVRAIACIAAILACLIVSTAVALRSHSLFADGLATGIWFASLAIGGYAWWVHRNAWKPMAQTTLAYAELTHKRAFAKAQTLRASVYMLLVTVAGMVGAIVWGWRSVHVRDVVILAALIAELFFLKNREQRKRQEAEETRKLIDQMREQ